MIIENETINADEVITHLIYDKYGELDRTFKKGDYLLHFKGHLCVFVGYSTHTETEEELVVYEHINDGKRRMFCRPKEMFLARVDGERYPEVEQAYRFVKVYLEKKSSSNTLESILIDEKTMLNTLYSIRQFLNRCSAKKGERLQFWVTGNDSTASLKMQRPSSLTNPALGGFSGVCGEASFIRSADFGRAIQFRGEELKETIRQGDIVHFVGENRMVVENIDEHVYEFFEIIPGLKDYWGS